MIDLSKPPSKDKLENIAEIFNLRYKMSFFPYLFTLFLLPFLVGFILYNYNIHLFWISIIVVATIIIAFYSMKKYFREQNK